MKFSKLALAAAALTVILLTSGVAEAGRVFFSLSASDPDVERQGKINPTVNATVGDSVTVYLWYERTVTADTVVGMSLDVGASTGGIVSASAFNVDNPIFYNATADAHEYRWGSGNPDIGDPPAGTFGGTLNSSATLLVNDTNAAKVSGTAIFGRPGDGVDVHGITDNFPAHNTTDVSRDQTSTRTASLQTNDGNAGGTNPGTTGASRYGSFTFTASAAGSTELRIGVGNFGIDYSNLALNADFTFFGWGAANTDPRLEGNTQKGQFSTLADLTINVAPATPADDSVFTMISPANGSNQSFNLLLNANGSQPGTFAKAGTTAGDYQLTTTGVVSGAAPASGTVGAGPVTPVNYNYTVNTLAYQTAAAGSVTLDNVNNPADPNDTFTVTARIGEAQTNGVLFGGALTASTPTGANYIGLASRTTAGTEVGATVIGTEARILAGVNNTGTDTTVNMQWRARTPNETSADEGGSPTYPPLTTSSGLVSDVVRVSGMLNGGANPDQTDVYVLQMTYDDTLIPGDIGEAALAALGKIYLAWLNPDEASPVGKWRNAVAGNEGINTGTANFQGTWAEAGSPLALGSWGVDTDLNLVWAVLDHQGDFAAVPEPSTLALLGLGVAGLLVARRRRTA